jgi:thiol:disulfide interchange protein DsbC
MNIRLLALAFVTAALVTGAACGSEATVKTAVQKRIPRFPVENVSKTPLAGIYEVFGDGQIIYVNEDASYVLSGELIDIEKSANLTQERMSKLMAIKFEDLPLELAFKKVKGKGSRKFAYFGDPNCGYCKRFEEGLSQINDVTIYVFLLPVLGPDSIAKARSIWCSKDRVKAWDDQLVRNITPTAPTTCANPIDKILAYGGQKKISGTPTIIFADGERVPGMLPPEAIEKRLAAATPR